jgi:hypothetical protein
MLLGILLKQPAALCFRRVFEAILIAVRRAKTLRPSWASFSAILSVRYVCNDMSTERIHKDTEVFFTARATNRQLSVHFIRRASVSY